MLKSGRGPLARIESLIEAWRIFEPNRVLFGMTLTQFQAVVKPAYDVRAELADLAKRTRGTRARKKDIDIDVGDAAQNIVHAIKAEPALGENSAVYVAAGYTRKSDRYVSRKRARKSSVPPAPEGDLKQDAKPAKPEVR